MIQAVIFDVDGLLVDSEPYWNQARVEIAAKVGKDWNDNDRRACMGVSTMEWANYMVRRLGLNLSSEQVQAQVVSNIQNLYARSIPFLPGAVEAVDLAARHYLVGIASGSHPSLVNMVIGDRHVRGKFKAVVYSDELAAGKPAPDVYLVAAHKLGVNPAECVCLEDSANGILAGKAAGMKVIAVPDQRFPPPEQVLRMADAVLPSLREFTLDAIRSLDANDAS